MKTYTWALTAFAAATLAFTGCSKKESSVSVDTATLEHNFKEADAATKGSADKAASAIKSGDYAAALTQLKTLAADAKLTPAQQQAVKDVMAQVQQAVTGAAGKAAEDASKTATKAVDDAKGALPVPK